MARLGGDEYTVMMRPVRDVQEVATCAQKLIDTLSGPFNVEGHELFITCSIGMSMFPDDACDAATLLKNADIAMYRAKEQGKNTYQFFSSEATAATFEHLMLETSLRRALEREEFVLHFQPIVDLRSQRVTSMETLVRWQHPDFGHGVAGQVHSARRGNRPDRSDRAMGAGARLPRRARFACARALASCTWRSIYRPSSSASATWHAR